MRFLVTGTAGFIGFHLANRLIDEGHEVVGVDGFVPTTYDARLKERRDEILSQRVGFKSYRTRLEDMARLEQIWGEQAVDVVVHLAAQAGVRYSLEQPRAFIESNLLGTFNVMELVRRWPVRHFMLASTSSAYGANTSMPYRETDRAVHPLTIYAATKAATELMAHSYSHLWSIPTTAFRFFTVYGAWNRPDMAPYKFIKGIVEGTPIDVYNHGDMRRDFTYVGDLVECIYRLSGRVPVLGRPAATFDTLSPAAPYRLVNIGAGKPINLMDFIEELERQLGKPALRNYLPMQAGDVHATFADAELLEALIGYRPSTPLAVGVKAVVDWYRDYHR